MYASNSELYVNISFSKADNTNGLTKCERFLV